MVNVKELKSHPDKLLFKHVDGVLGNVQKITNRLSISRIAELAAIFHDLGKINPNFQQKLIEGKSDGYSHHAYFSAFAFYTFCIDKENRNLIKSFLKKNLNQNELIALLIIIAKHHGHLPDFIPKGNLEIEPYIISKDEIDSLFTFLQNTIEYLPAESFVSNYFTNEKINAFSQFLNDCKIKNSFKDKIIFNNRNNINPLDFFLETQFAFSVLIQADKADAMDSPIIDDDDKRIHEFCSIYSETLNQYISKFKGDTELNQARTQIREEAILNIRNDLKSDKRVFELTAPTGSGKTVMLLSLASKIIRNKGDYRIIYALPFLSITEQVETEVLDIFKEFRGNDYIQRIDSKSTNSRFDNLQKDLDLNPDETKMKELDFLAFQERVFAYPFVITTFVQFFETLLSNRNSTLLKLPNFSKSIFLIDEIQSLPPRLYTFLIAYLSKFCEKFDCYAIISTATQPNFNLQNKIEITDFFESYELPRPLLDYKKYFESDIFNRYQINHLKNPIDFQELTQLLAKEENSVLVIVNTIDDSKELYSNLKEYLCMENLFLLNTHFTPNDRKKKIQIIKERLNKNKKTILISTQLIEAGVDIDFPVLYRDFALISSIVQSAGRCNRNGRMVDKGKVVVFNLQKNGKSRANLIYGRGKEKEILKFTKSAIANTDNFQEKELLTIQQEFFTKISQELNFGRHSQNKGKIEFDFIKDIKDCAFEKAGKFQLIDENEFGIVMQFFVPIDDNDYRFESLLGLKNEMKANNINLEQVRILKLKIKNHLKEMANSIVSVRIKTNETKPLFGSDEDYYGIWKISLDSYSFEKGVDVKGENFIL